MDHKEHQLNQRQNQIQSQFKCQIHRKCQVKQNHILILNQSTCQVWWNAREAITHARNLATHERIMGAIQVGRAEKTRQCAMRFTVVRSVRSSYASMEG